MGQKYISCHEWGRHGAPGCNTIFTADNEKELLEIVVRHGINVHGHSNTEAYREAIRSHFIEGKPLG